MQPGVVYTTFHFPESGANVDHHRQLRLGHQLPRVQGHRGAGVLATPSDLEDFAVGFSLSEGIVARRGDIFGIEVEESAAGITLKIETAAGDSCASRSAAAAWRGAPVRPVRYREPGPGAARTDAAACRRGVSAGCALRRDARAAGAAAAAAGDRRHARRLPRRPRWRDQPRARGRRPPQRAGQDPGRAGARGHRCHRRCADHHQPRQRRDGAEGRCAARWHAGGSVGADRHGGRAGGEIQSRLVRLPARRPLRRLHEPQPSREVLA
jgi:hypothetical protein